MILWLCQVSIKKHRYFKLSVQDYLTRLFRGALWCRLFPQTPVVTRHRANEKKSSSSLSSKRRTTWCFAWIAEASRELKMSEFLLYRVKWSFLRCLSGIAKFIPIVQKRVFEPNFWYFSTVGQSTLFWHFQRVLNTATGLWKRDLVDENAPWP